MDSTEIIHTLLRSGVDDWVAVDDVVWSVTQGSITDADKANVLEVLSRLYGEGLMVPGDLLEEGFVDWSGSASDWLAKSLAEIDLLDWRPMGAGFWLRLTERGESLIRNGE